MPRCTCICTLQKIGTAGKHNSKFSLHHAPQRVQMVWPNPTLVGFATVRNNDKHALLRESCSASEGLGLLVQSGVPFPKDKSSPR